MPRTKSEAGVDRSPGQEPDQAISSAIFSRSGYGSIDQKSFSMPYLTIVQDRSQVVQRGTAAYDPSVKVGEFYCAAHRFSAPHVQVRVLRIDHVVVTWVQPTGGGGGQIFGIPLTRHPYAAMRDLTAGVSDKFRPYDRDGNELRETIEYTLLDVERGNLMIFSMAGTALRPGRDWNTRIRSLRVDPLTWQPDPQGRSGVATWVGVWELTPRQTPGGWYNIGSSPRLLRTLDAGSRTEVPELLAYAEEAEQHAAAMNSRPALPESSAEGSRPRFEIDDSSEGKSGADVPTF